MKIRRNGILDEYPQRIELFCHRTDQRCDATASRRKRGISANCAWAVETAVTTAFLCSSRCPATSRHIFVAFAGPLAVGAQSDLRPTRSRTACSLNVTSGASDTAGTPASIARMTACRRLEITIRQEPYRLDS